MNVTSSGCSAHLEQAALREHIDATAQFRCAAWTDRLRFAFATALAVAMFGMLAGLASPARAERGLEWEPGGMLYKYLDRYDPRKRSKRRARVPAHTSHDDDETDTYGAGDDSYDDETHQRRSRKARHRVRHRQRTHQRRRARSRRHSTRKRVRVASLGTGVSIPQSESRPRRSVTGGSGVRWAASSGCLNARLKAAIYHVAQNYGRVRVNSTCRSRRHNRRVGGARRSWHLTGNAADIRIWGNVRAAARYLRSVAGGYKHYGGGLFHIDTGPRRTW